MMNDAEKNRNSLPGRTVTFGHTICEKRPTWQSFESDHPPKPPNYGRETHSFASPRNIASHASLLRGRDGPLRAPGRRPRWQDLVASPCSGHRCHPRCETVPAKTPRVVSSLWFVCLDLLWRDRHCLSEVRRSGEGSSEDPSVTALPPSFAQDVFCADTLNSLSAVMRCRPCHGVML